MYKETLAGKPERVGKITPPPIKETQELMSSANRAVENYTAQGAVARHPLGRGTSGRSPSTQLGGVMAIQDTQYTRPANRSRFGLRFRKNDIWLMKT